MKREKSSKREDIRGPNQDRGQKRIQARQMKRQKTNETRYRTLDRVHGTYNDK